MSNERIDVTRSGVWNLLFEKFDEDAWGIGSDNIIDDIEYLVRQAGLPQELKRCYERIDALEKVVAGVACVECLSDDGCYPPCSKYDPDAS